MGDEVERRRSQINKYLEPKKLIEWVNGVPIPYTQFILPKQKLDDVILAAMALPYEGGVDEFGEPQYNEDYKGLSNAEVMAINIAKKAAGGSVDAAKFLMDRLLGKPKQQVNVASVQMTLGEFLQNLEPDKPTYQTIDIEDL